MRLARAWDVVWSAAYASTLTQYAYRRLEVPVFVSDVRAWHSVDPFFSFLFTSFVHLGASLLPVDLEKMTGV